MEKELLSQELEEMRSQITLLKEKLNRQAIVNERNIRKSLKAKVSDINHIIGATILIGILGTLYCTFLFYKIEFSLAFIIVTAVMLLVCVGLTIRQRIYMKGVNIAEGSLVENAEIISKLRTHYKGWVKKALPMIIIWLAWLIAETFIKFGNDTMAISFTCGAVIGAILGGILGLRINRKVVESATEILNQINDLRCN